MTGESRSLNKFITNIPWSPFNREGSEDNGTDLSGKWIKTTGCHSRAGGNPFMIITMDPRIREDDSA